MIKILQKTTILLLLSSLTIIHADSVHYELAESSRSIMRVGPNQSLDLLVEQIYPNNETLWPRIKEEIRRINPGAFNRYTGRLIVGQRLKLVTIKQINQRVAFTQDQVGEVSAIKGYAVVTDNNGNDNRLSLKSVVYEGDRVVTSPDSELELSMIDGAKMRIKEDSAVRISEYEMKSGFESGSKSIIDLIKGGLRKITGSIGANPLSIYRFHTGVMTIGVRGTDFVVKLCNENDCEVSAGRNDQTTRLHVVVLDGLITLQDEEGVQGELALGQYAVATSDKKVRVDDSVPVKGLLNQEELELFNKMELPLQKEASVWPWILGGALLGL